MPKGRRRFLYRQKTSITLTKTYRYFADNVLHFFYRNLRERKNEQGYLWDTCLAARDKFKVYLDYFQVPYK